MVQLGRNGCLKAFLMIWPPVDHDDEAVEDDDDGPRGIVKLESAVTGGSRHTLDGRGDRRA